jgi:hypothetical protein
MAVLWWACGAVRYQVTSDYYFFGIMAICAAMVIRDWKKYK